MLLLIITIMTLLGLCASDAWSFMNQVNVQPLVRVVLYTFGDVIDPPSIHICTPI